MKLSDRKMITTFGVTAPTGSRPVAVVAPMRHQPPADPVNKRPQRDPCTDPGAEVPLPTPNTTNTATLKDLTVTCSGATSPNSFREPLGKSPSVDSNRSVPTMRTSPLRNLLPVLGTSEASVLGTTGQGLLRTKTQRTSLIGTSVQGSQRVGTSTFGFRCPELTVTWSGSEGAAASSRDTCQFSSGTPTRDGRTDSVLGHPCGVAKRTSADDVVAALEHLSLQCYKLDSVQTKDKQPDILTLTGTPSASSVFMTSSSSSHRPDSLSSLALSSEPMDPSRTVAESNFYYGAMTNTEAKSRLHRCSVGTFLLRDSSDPRFLVSLSVKTSRGTTSIRIASTPTGHFRLDSDPNQESRMMPFPSILSLVEYYFLSAANSSSTEKGGRHQRGRCVLLESSGRFDTPMLLRKPLELSPAPLAHLCRRTINYLVPSIEVRGKLIDTVQEIMGVNAQISIREYMNSYPFRV